METEGEDGGDLNACIKSARELSSKGTFRENIIVPSIIKNFRLTSLEQLAQITQELEHSCPDCKSDLSPRAM